MSPLLDAGGAGGSGGRDLPADDDSKKPRSTANNGDKDKDNLIHIVWAGAVGCCSALIGVLIGAWLWMPNVKDHR
jgi:hypothetical protein